MTFNDHRMAVPATSSQHLLIIIIIDKVERIEFVSCIHEVLNKLRKENKLKLKLRSTTVYFEQILALNWIMCIVRCTMDIKALVNISARNDALNKFKVCDVDSGITYVLIPKAKCRQLHICYSGIHCSHLMCPYMYTVYYIIWILPSTPCSLPITFPTKSNFLLLKRLNCSTICGSFQISFFFILLAI